MCASISLFSTFPPVLISELLTFLILSYMKTLKMLLKVHWLNSLNRFSCNCRLHSILCGQALRSPAWNRKEALIHEMWISDSCHFFKKELEQYVTDAFSPCFRVQSVLLPVYPPSTSESSWVRKYWTQRKGDSQSINDCLISVDALQLVGGSPPGMSKATV